ncbi:MAG: HAMP domain-containing protein [Firmicutes bacterium]|nr:HAMP domain-containing protein [Bacillota bacterium]
MIKNLKSRSFFSRLMLSHLIIIFISLTVIGIMFGYLIQNYYFGLKEWEATNNSRRIAELVSENISGGNIRSNKINEDSEKIKTIARSSNMDIGLMNARGEMILNAPTIKEFNLTLEKTEIDHVLEGNTITKKIMGPEYKNLLMVIPLVEADNNNIVTIGPQIKEKKVNLVGAVIIQTPLGSIAATINNIIRLVLYSFLVAIIAAVFLSISFTKRVTKPLEDVQSSALKSAEGKFQEVAIPENSSIEIEHLVNTFNYAVFQINETFKKKQQLEKMRKEFVADVSHEFRAPLTSIKGFLEIISDQELTPAELKDCINIMYKDTEYLEHLLSDLLTLGKLESENTKLNKEYISPDILVSRAIKTMKNKLEEKQVNLIMETAEQLPKIHVDVNRVHQVLINLLENALTYSPVRANITIRLESVDPNDDLDPGKRKVKFSIIDEGPGIPENEMDNIWQRFYKVDRARTREQKKGSGLGLAIVKDIILKHGGNVAVKNTPEAGASFMFSL